MKRSDVTKIKPPKISKNKEDVKKDFDLDNMFSGDLGESDTKIVKELISGSDVEQKTELTATQISLVSRLYFYSELTDLPELKVLLDKLLVLQISKDRKSRKEFVEGLGGIRDNKNGSGFFQNLGGMFQK